MCVFASARPRRAAAMGGLMMRAGREREAGSTGPLPERRWSEQPLRRQAQPHMSTLVST